jgi:hypothetical protein
MLRTSLTDTSGLTLAPSRRSPSATSPDSADVRATSVIALGMRRSSATACGNGMYSAPVIRGGVRPESAYWRTSPTTPTTVRQSLSQTTRILFPIASWSGQ